MKKQYRKVCISLILAYYKIKKCRKRYYYDFRNKMPMIHSYPLQPTTRKRNDKEMKETTAPKQVQKMVLDFARSYQCVTVQNIKIKLYLN